MTAGTTDIFLLIIIVSSLVVGFFWGAARSLMLLAAWILAFLAGAYLKVELGAYLSRYWDNFTPAFNEMAAFGLIYVGLLLAAPILVMIILRGNQHITRLQVLDDAVGAIFAVFVAVLGIAGVIIVLSTFYGADGATISATGGPVWTANLYASLLESNIGEAINERMVPFIGFVLGPILPPEVAEAIP